MFWGLSFFRYLDLKKGYSLHLYVQKTPSVNVRIHEHRFSIRVNGCIRSDTRSLCWPCGALNVLRPIAIISGSWPIRLFVFLLSSFRFFSSSSFSSFSCLSFSFSYPLPLNSHNFNRTNWTVPISNLSLVSKSCSALIENRVKLCSGTVTVFELVSDINELLWNVLNTKRNHINF